MKPIFKGVCTALVTPFDENGAVDFAAFKKLIDFQIDGKADALLVLGTTGEAPTLTAEEKKQIVEFAVKHIDKRVPLIVGIGGNNPKSIIEFGQWLKIFGGSDGVLVSSPYYNKATQAGLVEFFSHIAEEVALPMIVYNVPARSGINIEPATLAEICENRWVAGIKEASGSIQQIADAIRLAPMTAVYAGDDALALPSYALGAVGVISVASNIAPASVGEIYRKTVAGEANAARILFLNALPMYKTLFCEVNPIPVKHALNCMGLIENKLRLPLTPLEEKHRGAVSAMVDSLITY